MGNFFKSVKAGMSGFAEGMSEAAEPREYLVAGRKVTCPHCQRTRFSPGKALLNSAGRTFFNLDWTDPSATLLVCAECGRIEWFAHAPEEVPRS